MAAGIEAGIEIGDDGHPRCGWGARTPDYLHYHDTEWGLPVDDDNRLFEKLCLEGFQSGLSWLTILRKRENFRRAFADFELERIARFNTRSVDRMLRDASIVRHRGKIESTLNNARRAVELRDEFGSLGAYFWQWEPAPASRPKRLTLAKLEQLVSTPESTALSKDLKRRGWTFVGPTTVYAFMQAMGIVNDHLSGCDFREPSESARHRFRRPR